MSSVLPQISGAKMGKILVRLGFELRSQEGSHMKYQKIENNIKIILIIPKHKTLKKGTLSGILNHLEITPIELKKLL